MSPISSSLCCSKYVFPVSRDEAGRCEAIVVAVVWQSSWRALFGDALMGA